MELDSLLAITRPAHGPGILFGYLAHFVVQAGDIIVAPGFIQDADRDGKCIRSQVLHHFTVTSQHLLGALVLIKHWFDHTPASKDLFQGRIFLVSVAMGAIEVLYRILEAYVHLTAWMRSAVMQTSAAPRCIKPVVVRQAEFLKDLGADRGADIVTAEADVLLWDARPDRNPPNQSVQIPPPAAMTRACMHLKLDIGQQIQQGMHCLGIIIETGI